MQEYGGELPHQAQALLKLPGIGRYTAGAIASMAFGQDEPALDGNIRRVLARVFNVAEPARSPEGEQRLWALAAANLPPGRAGDYNQALMDLGALVCTPRDPDCPNCPLAELCQARLLGVQAAAPGAQIQAGITALRRHGSRHRAPGALLNRPTPFKWPAGWSMGIPRRQAAAWRGPGILFATRNLRRAGSRGQCWTIGRRIPPRVYPFQGHVARLPLRPAERPRTPGSAGK